MPDGIERDPINARSAREKRDYSQELPPNSGVRVEVGGTAGLLMRDSDYLLPPDSAFERIPLLERGILLFERSSQEKRDARNVHPFPVGVKYRSGNKAPDATEDEILMQKILCVVRGNGISPQWESIAVQREDGTYLVVDASYQDSKRIVDKKESVISHYFSEGDVIKPEDLKEIES